MDDYKYCVVCHQGFSSGKPAYTAELLTFIKDSGPVQAVYRHDNGDVANTPINSKVRLFKTAKEAEQNAKAHNEALEAA